MIRWFYICFVVKQTLTLDLGDICPKPLYTGSIELLTTNESILFDTSDDIFSGDFFDRQIFYGISKYRINISIDYNNSDYYLYEYYLIGLHNFETDYLSTSLIFGNELIIQSSLVMNLTAYYSYDNGIFTNQKIVTVSRNIEANGIYNI